MDRKIRVTLADHEANVKTRSGDVWRARVAVKNAEAARDAHELAPSKNAKSMAEHDAAVAIAVEKVDRAIADWEAAKVDRDAVRVADGVTVGKSKSTGARSNGAVSTVSESALAKINRLLCGVSHATAPDADWTVDARDTLVDWLLSVETFYVPAPWSETEQSIIAARSAVDALAVDDATKTMLLANMLPMPTRKQSSAAPMWGTLPETIAAEQSGADAETDDDDAADDDDDAETVDAETAAVRDRDAADAAAVDAARQRERDAADADADAEPTDADLAALEAAVTPSAETSPIADAMKTAIRARRAKAA